MRPKKVVLCVDLNTERVGDLCYVLRVRGYKPRQAATIEAALTALETRIDCLIIRGLPPWMQKRLVDAVRVMQSNRPPVLQLGGDRETGAEFVLPEVCNTAVILERLMIMVARKRGRKPATKLALTEEQLIERIRLGERKPSVAVGAEARKAGVA